ncbi:MAG: Na+/H+ antiporter subunit E [Terrimicrobiaceae bacterium]|nr:Na+/H+ antiporter subunit E [Terrimicrobiaceae bacterium]
MMLPILNLLLALLWAGLFGEFSATTLLSGFLLSYFVLMVVARGGAGYASYFGKIPKVLAFGLYYLKELVKSNLIVAYDVLTPKHHMRPGVVAIPIRARTDFEITLLANLISMTPGTLSLDISADRKVLFVHAMYVKDPEELRRDITENLERRVLEILR